MSTRQILVIGGGLGGLAAAAYLARAGQRVTLLERSSTPGGRARTSQVQGFHLNLGPHALYQGSAARHVLDELGVPLAGGMPSLRGGLAARGERLYDLPLGPWTRLTRGLLRPRDRLAAARALRRIPTLDADVDALAGMSAGDWVRGLDVSPAVQALLHALIRLSAYANAPDMLDAACAIRQMLVSRAGVLYLDGGWQSLVDRLYDVAARAGVDIRTRVRAVSVHRGPDSLEVHTADGALHAGRAVVVATPPEVAAALLAPVSRAVQDWSARCVPVRVGCLDLALSHLPRPRATVALGIDQPLYFSVHSKVAALAPAGGAVIHAAMYLHPGQDEDPHALRERLEAFVDRVQPGWREHLVHARFMPAMTVSGALPLAAHKGMRPGPLVPDAPGVFVVGDWVGSKGMLADAALASARDAARLAAALDAPAHPEPILGRISG